MEDKFKLTEDQIINSVVKKIVIRSEVGQKKYGVTLADDPGDLKVFLNHLQEELLDATNYIETAIARIEALEKSIKNKI